MEAIVNDVCEGSDKATRLSMQAEAVASMTGAVLLSAPKQQEAGAEQMESAPPFPLLFLHVGTHPLLPGPFFHLPCSSPAPTTLPRSTAPKSTLTDFESTGSQARFHRCRLIRPSWGHRPT